MRKKLFNAMQIVGLLIFIIAFIFLLQSSMKNSLEEKSIQSYGEKIVRPLLSIEENNGIVTNIWLEDEKKLEKFVENDIKYLFVDVGDIDRNGKLITSEKELKHFLDLIDDFEKENDYDFVLLPYTEVIIKNSNKYSLHSDAFINIFINNYKDLIKIGFEGAHVDIEAIPFNQREDYLNFLEKLDNVIGNGNMLTVYSGALNENPNIWEWESDFYSAVSDRSDIISIPAYDFNFNDKEAYQAYVKEQIKSISSKEWSSNFMLTAPTHKSFPETLENSLESYKEGIEVYEKNPFIGIAIFAEWTTDDFEWEVFEEYFK